MTSSFGAEPAVHILRRDLSSWLDRDKGLHDSEQGTRDRLRFGSPRR